MTELFLIVIAVVVVGYVVITKSVDPVALREKLEAEARAARARSAAEEAARIREIELSAARRRDPNTLFVAASKGDLALLRAGLDAGADPNLKDADGWTLLHWAAQANQKGAITFLLRSGADPRRRNDEGRTPADFARTAGHASAAQLLS